MLNTSGDGAYVLLDVFFDGGAASHNVRGLTDADCFEEVARHRTSRECLIADCEDLSEMCSSDFIMCQIRKDFYSRHDLLSIKRVKLSS